MESTATVIDTSKDEQVVEIRQDTEKYLAPISIFRVVDSESMTMAECTIKDINARLKAIDDKLEPKRKKAYEAYKEWPALIKELKEPLENAKAYLAGEGKRYLEEQERLRQQEEDRLRLVAKQEEEDAILRYAEEAEKNGDYEGAEAILTEEVYVPPPVVERTVPKVDKRLFSRRWTGRGTDIEKAIRFIARNPQYKNLLTFNEPAINAMARSIKSKSPVEGIEFMEV